MWKLILTILVCCAFLEAEIVISRDENGHIVISNRLEPEKRPLPRPAKKSSAAKPLSTFQGYVREKIVQAALRFSFDPQIAIAVAHIESGFNPFAISHKGAVGVMQLMDETARDYGVTDRFQLDQNIEAGVRHLKRLHQKYSGNLKLILAAYNAGENAVEKYNGVPPFRETRDYIRKIYRLLGMVYETKSSGKKQIFKLTTPEGKVMITDAIPSGFKGRIETI